ncbi:MAG: hydrogenase nickel incorporation protein HypB [Candidatus Alcyoniella australis]|nr:hydrogenase nickel incorporation protein HypB [Candidatus Alcyoniella australis]
MTEIQINKDPRSPEQRIAQQVRQDLLRRKILALNLISSPGSGKTTLLEQTLPRLAQRYKLAVVEADCATRNDADRLEKLGIEVEMICAGVTACHIPQPTAKRAIEALNLDGLELLVIENVGNLVCPADEDLGEDHKIALLSAAEGEDKPLKYPLLFQCASLVLLNKIDAADALGADLDLMERNVRATNPNVEVLRISARTGEGLERWIDWIETRIRQKRDA